MTSIVNIQNALNAGELSPNLFGRTDLDKYNHGCSTARNFFASYTGGMSSRAGLAYVGMCKQQYPVPPRDIPFQFSLDQGYVLEFGDNYMRVKFDGAYVLEAAKPVTSVTDYFTYGMVFEVSGHGYSVGDWFYDLGNEGFSGLTWIVSSIVAPDKFNVTNLFGTPIVDGTSSTGGTVSRIYEAVSPYAAEDLPYLKYTQSADVMTLTCVNQETGTEYPPYSLSRISNTNWVFTEDTFTSNINAPTGLTAKAQSSTTISTWYSYVVTAVDSETGEESVPSDPVSVQNVDIAVNVGSNSLAWTQVPGATSYNVYAATPSYSVDVPISSLYGFVGTCLGPAFTDTNITPDFTKVPPKHYDPFTRGRITDVTVAGTQNGNYSQSTVGYSVTTSTGVDFSGVPIVSDGNIVGFLINNEGYGYQSGDTISFSDSGGGRASGTMTFFNPADGDALIFNDVSIKFTDTPNYPSDVGEPFLYSRVENTAALTVQTLANTLNASNVLSLSVAEYSASGSVLTVKYKTPGSVGNSYTLVVPGLTPVVRSGATLTGGGTAGSGATGTLTISEQSGTYPGVAAYFQQRRVYASTLNRPDTYWMSQPGLYSNMDSSIPVTDSDSIVGTPWAQQVNGIQFMVPMPGGLVILTGEGAWQVSGGSTAGITPSNQTAVPQAYNGCNATVPPQTINNDILYVQSKGSIWRDLSYNFYNNIYTGTDLTVLSSHLFTNYQSVQAAWAEEPFKVMWVVRNDGTLLGLTFLKEQEIYAWTRHDTNGLFVGVCSITEIPVDAVYVIVQRYVEGAWRYYSERMDDRIWNNVEDSFCVDAGVRYGGTLIDATLEPAAAEGEDITFTTDSAVFTADHEGWIIRADGGKATITTYVSPTEVECEITEPMTTVLRDTANGRPVPCQPNTWSLSEPVTTITGLNHLEGMEVAILADGSVVPNQTVEDGQITLQWPASLITVGLPYTCQLQTMYMDGPPINGQSLQNRRKNISSVGLRVQGSRGLQLGCDQVDSSTQQNFRFVPWTDMNEIKERTMDAFAGTAVPLYTGDYYKNVSATWRPQGQIAVQQVYPLPANILALISYYTVGDE
jgi:hypothetical protein